MRFEDVTYNQIQQENQNDMQYMRNALKRYQKGYHGRDGIKEGTLDFSDIVKDFYHEDCDGLGTHIILECFRRIVRAQAKGLPEDYHRSQVDTNIYENYPMRANWLHEMAHSYDVLGNDNNGESAKKEASLHLRDIRRVEHDSFDWKRNNQIERKTAGLE